jgi:hypothetical protein
MERKGRINQQGDPILPLLLKGGFYINGEISPIARTE